MQSSYERPTVSDKDTKQGGAAVPEQESATPSQDASAEDEEHTAHPIPWFRRYRILLLVVVFVIIAVGIVLGVVPTGNRYKVDATATFDHHVGTGASSESLKCDTRIICTRLLTNASDAASASEPSESFGDGDEAPAPAAAPPASTSGGRGDASEGWADSAKEMPGGVSAKESSGEVADGEETIVARPAEAGGSSSVQSGQLTAADIDDNLNFHSFLDYKRRMRDSIGQSIQYQQAQLPDPDLSERITIRVSDESGAPFSCAQIDIIPQQQQAATAQISDETSAGPLSLSTGTNGNFYLFPALHGMSGMQFDVRAKAPGGTCPGACSQVVHVSPGVSDDSVLLQVPKTSSLPAQMDLVFVIDTTGSMCDELSYIQSELNEVISQLRAGVAQQDVDIRIAIIAYKDHGDMYVVSTIDFGAPQDVSNSLMSYSCGGGGDYPEAVDEALHAAADLQWRSGNVARILFLVADAPPHNNRLQAAFDAALRLHEMNVKIYGLAASGVADTAEYEMRLMGVVTGARYLWLTDDSGIGNPHAEPKVMCYQVTRLDQLLVRVLKSELSGERVEAEEDNIIREIGAQQEGVCMSELSTTDVPPQAENETDDFANGTSQMAENETEGLANVTSQVAENETIGLAGVPSPTTEGLANVTSQVAENETIGLAEVPSQTKSETGGLSTGAIVGIAVGAVAALCLVACYFYALGKKQSSAIRPKLDGVPAEGVSSQVCVAVATPIGNIESAPPAGQTIDATMYTVEEGKQANYSSSAQKVDGEKMEES